MLAQTAEPPATPAPAPISPNNQHDEETGEATTETARNMNTAVIRPRSASSDSSELVRSFENEEKDRKWQMDTAKLPFKSLSQVLSNGN